MPTMPENKQKTGFRGPSPDVGKPYRWKKGQSGNPSGRPKSKTLSDAYKSKLEELVPNDSEGRTWAELIAEAQVRDAVRGNVQAAREIADRTVAAVVPKPKDKLPEVSQIWSRKEYRAVADELLHQPGWPCLVFGSVKTVTNSLIASVFAFDIKFGRLTE